MTFRFLSLCAAFAATFLLPTLAYPQSATTGAIAGVVRDTTGAVVPGATVEAASPALIEKVKSTVTDDQGQYRIVDLRPGTYSVTFSLTGFSTVKREGVALTTGFTAAVNAELKIGELSETITVSGASPIVDTQNVRNQNVLTRELIEAIPVSQSTQGYAAVTLGVVIPATQQDVGGNRGESVTGSQVHGNRSTDSQRTFDGMGLNTMLGTGAGVNYYFKINSVMSQEVTLTTDGLSAEYETGGLVTNVVPRDGGNRWSGYGVGAFSNKSLQNTNLTDDLKTRGLLTAPVAKVIYDAGFGVGGPLKQDRLWFFAGARGWGAQQELANRYYNASTDPRHLFYTPDYSRAAYLDNWAHDSSVRLTHQVNSTNKLNYFLSWQRSCTCWVTGGAAALNYSPEASTEFHYDPIVMPMVAWNYVATPRLLFEAAGMYLYQTIDSTPTPETDLSTVSVTDLNHPVMGSNLVYNKNNMPLNGLQAYGGPNQSSHWDTRASMAYVTGSHALKVGLTTRSGVYNVTGVFDPPYAFTFNNLTPTSVRVFASPHFSESRLKLNMGIYAQDQWTMNRLTLNLGVRFNYFNAYNPAQSRPASDFYGIPAFDIAEQKNVPNWKDLDPRVGAAYDVFGNGKTALKVSWGRYVAAMASALSQVVNPANAMVTSATRTWNDATFGPGDPRTGNYFPDCDFRNQAVNGECQATNPTNFGTVNLATTFADDVLNGFGVRPYTWQGSVAVQHQVLPRLGLMVGYFRTSYGNFTVTDNQNLAPTDYDEYCVTVPTDPRLPTSGQQACGLYDQRQAVAQKNVIRQASDFGNQTQVFDGIDIGMNWRFGQGGILNGGMSTGQTVTNSCFVIDSPDLRYCEQTLPFAAQTQWKFNGSYPLPWYGILVAGTFQNLAGIPQLANRTYTNAEVLTSLGRNLCCASTTTVNNLYEPNIRLEDRLTQIDLRFTKEFKVGLHRLRPAFEVYNLLNSSTVTQVDATYGNTGATWLRPGGIVPARLFKFSLQYNF